MEEEKISEFFFRRNPYKVILTIGINKMSIRKLSRETYIPYSYLSKFLKKLKKLNLVCLEKNGREKYVIFTEKGIKLKNLFFQIKEILNLPLNNTHKKTKHL